MPELPDVEIFKQYANSTSLHQQIDKVTVHNPKILKGVSAGKLQRELRSHTLQNTHRHGKHLFIQFEADKWLELHFGMTGYLRYFKSPEKEPDHSRVLISFSNNYHLSYVCQRMLGYVNITGDPGSVIKENNLGPDALDEEFDFSAFKEAVSDRRGMLKSVLMNQEVLAGIGNVYSDEILFQCRLHPKREITELDEKALKMIFRSMKEVLKTAIENRVEPGQIPDSFLTAHRHRDDRCPRCNGKLEPIKVSGRTAYYCPECQNK